MICKECFHYEPCFSGGKSMWADIEQTEQDHCKHFKDKEKVNSALKKQIPQKPTPKVVDVEKIKIGNAAWCKGTTIYYCPNCNDFISRIYTYCHKCGQALDWSDTE